MEQRAKWGVSGGTGGRRWQRPHYGMGCLYLSSSSQTWHAPLCLKPFWGFGLCQLYTLAKSFQAKGRLHLATWDLTVQRPPPSRCHWTLLKARSSGRAAAMKCVCTPNSLWHARSLHLSSSRCWKLNLSISVGLRLRKCH